MFQVAYKCFHRGKRPIGIWPLTDSISRQVKVMSQNPRNSTSPTPRRTDEHNKRFTLHLCVAALNGELLSRLREKRIARGAVSYEFTIAVGPVPVSIGFGGAVGIEGRFAMG